MKPKPKPDLDQTSVQTVKLDSALLMRLKIFSAKTRRSHQDILHTALIEYLKKMNG